MLGSLGEWALLSNLGIGHQAHPTGGHQGGLKQASTMLSATVGKDSS